MEGWKKKSILEEGGRGRGGVEWEKKVMEIKGKKEKKTVRKVLKKYKETNNDNKDGITHIDRHKDKNQLYY